MNPPDQNPDNPRRFAYSRREFIKQTALGGAVMGIGLPAMGFENFDPEIHEQEHTEEAQSLEVRLSINGNPHVLNIDPRVTLLDALRENLSMPGTKKGCDHGQCGACTVLIDGRRINSCLKLAAMCEGVEIITIEGLAKGKELHPMQSAFIKHDAFQCGFCTPGQICSAIGLIHEDQAKTDSEIRELMSGNICRCGAYQNILAAIREVTAKPVV